jgi:hypothetical protein
VVCSGAVAVGAAKLSLPGGGRETLAHAQAAEKVDRAMRDGFIPPALRDWALAMTDVPKVYLGNCSRPIHLKNVKRNPDVDSVVVIKPQPPNNIPSCGKHAR